MGDMVKNKHLRKWGRLKIKLKIQAVDLRAGIKMEIIHEPNPINDLKLNYEENYKTLVLYFLEIFTMPE